MRLQQRSEPQEVVGVAWTCRVLDFETGETRERLGDLREGRHPVHHAGVDGALRHPRLSCGRGILGDHQAARGLDVTDARAAVAAGAGEDEPRRPIAVLTRQRAEQVVDGKSDTSMQGGRAERDPPIDHRERGVGRDDVDGVGLDAGPVGRFDHGHRRVSDEQLTKQARVGRVQVLNEDERHARVRRKHSQELPERLEASCGGTHTHHEGGGFARARVTVGCHD